MSRRYLLESVYTSAEYDPRFPTSLRAVGILLDAVLEGPPPDHEMEQMLQRLEPRPTCH